MNTRITTIFTAIIMFAITFTFNACSDSSSDDPTPPAVSSSGGGLSGGKNSSSSGGDNNSSSSTGGANELGCGEWAVTTPATCVAEGVETRTCTGSNPRTETRAIPIDPDEHDWELISGTAATCSKEGNGDEICKHCGKEIKGVLPIDHNAHNWGLWASKTPAMCTEKAVEEKVCSHNALHKEDREVGEPLGHDNGTWHETAPTCTANGSKELRCNRDNEVLETGTLAQLSWNDWTVTTPATPTTVGLETRTCPNNASLPQTNPLYPKCNGVEYDPADGKFCDNRDNKFYKYVDINGQVWTAENLNFNADGSKCGNVSTGTLTDNATDCDKYGRLYDWATAMNISQSCNYFFSDCNAIIQPKHQGVCPDGWHLPSGADWDALISFIHTDKGLSSFTSGTSNYAGKYLKATSDWSSGSNGTDDYGFSALPGGWGPYGGFGEVGDYGGWWSASEYNGGNAYYGYLYFNEEHATWDTGDKGILRSVRCVRD